MMSSGASDSTFTSFALSELHEVLRSRVPSNVCVSMTSNMTIRVDVFSAPLLNVAAFTLTIKMDKENKMELRLIAFDDSLLDVSHGANVSSVLEMKSVQELLANELHLCQGIRDQGMMDNIVHKQGVDCSKWFVEPDFGSKLGLRLRSRECEKRVQGELRVCWQCASACERPTHDQKEHDQGGHELNIECDDIKREIDEDEGVKEGLLTSSRLRQRTSMCQPPLDDEDEEEDDGDYDGNDPNNDDDFEDTLMEGNDDNDDFDDERPDALLSDPGPVVTRRRRRRRKDEGSDGDSDHPMPMQCVICLRKFKRRILYKKHMDNHKVRIPNLQQPINCPVCHQQYPSIMELNPHMQGVHGNGTLWCVVCCEVVAEEQFAVHFKNRHELAVKRHLCSVCGEKFRTPRDLHVHTTMKHDPKPSMLVCEECGRPFRHRVKLNIHVRTTHRKIELPCNQCGKTFNRIGKLQKHVLIHAQSKPYSCAHCSYRSVRRDMVRLHVRRTHHKDAVADDVVVDERAAAAVDVAVANALIVARPKSKEQLKHLADTQS